MRRTFLCGCLLLGMGAAVPGQTGPGTPQISSVSNAASGAETIQSGSWVSIYGSNLSTTTRTWAASDIQGGVLPTTLDNVSVLINGKKAAVYFISPGQVNVQAPADTATGSVPVQVTNSLGTAAGRANLQAYAPGIFLVDGKYAAARHSDGVLVAPTGLFGSAATSRPAVPGETLQVYATGLGPTTPAAPIGQVISTPAPLASLSQLRVTIGGQTATVSYAGVVGPGLYQVNAVVPQLVDGDQTIAATISGASSQTGALMAVKNTVTGTVTVTLTPNNSTIRCGATLTLTARVTNTTNQLIAWQVNGVAGGNAQVGTVSATGVYTAPAVLPSSPAVTITAASQQDANAKASVTVNLQNAIPVLMAVSPNPIPAAATTITVAGTGFATNATISVGGAVLPTTFISDNMLSATTTLAMPVGRLAAVKVANPNPGAATSAPMAIPVRPAAEKMSYAEAVRFLDMASFGGTPQEVANLQSIGRDAWLEAQFAKPVSAWPAPNNAGEGVSRLQTAFFDIAMTGADQLRQRVAFALAQVLVVSAVKNTQYQQMVPYQRLMADSAFGSYRDLMTAITLDPTMGFFLDMVNNDKANPTTGSVANENYAREIMQLFTIGLVRLNSDGTPALAEGAAVPEYSQKDVAELAKVMTGWTYGQTPNFASNWNNPAYFFTPMIAFQDHHDTTAKTINLPIPCNIPAGGTAENDLNSALDCLFSQENVAPFVSYQLIQRLVMSSPSPAFVNRVAAVFRSSRGNLKSVVTAILTDPEATEPGSGKLAEPVLYATGLLRALNANDRGSSSLPGQTNSMGQNVLVAPTVFNYFSPSYQIPGLSPGVVAPEFQLLNAPSALARANFAYRAVTNGISSTITVDIANLIDLANNPADLVEAVNQALFRGEMDSGMRAALTSAANASTNLTTRVRSVLYAAAASPQYQVKQ